MPGAAMLIGAATSESPSMNRRTAPFASNCVPCTPRKSSSSAPKRSAWRPAMRASSAPPTPSGKPKKFSIIDVCEAWPPGRSRSMTMVERPSEAA